MCIIGQKRSHDSNKRWIIYVMCRISNENEDYIHLLALHLSETFKIGQVLQDLAI